MKNHRDTPGSFGSESRCRPRYVLLPPIETIVVPVQSGRQVVFHADIANLSENGLACFMTLDEAEAIEPGRQVRIRFAVGDEPPLSRILARVVHQTPAQSPDRRIVGFVWEDDDSGQRARQAIRTFLSETTEISTEVA